MNPTEFFQASDTVVLDRDNFRPINEYHLVRFSTPAEVSEGGVYLPERYQENFVEAEVLASGPGKKFDGERVTPMWAKPGDIVLFQKHTFTPLVGQREGLVRDSELVAIVYSNYYDGRLFPMNDWVMIDRYDEDEFEGSVIIPEEYRTRHKRGKLLGWGPGSIIKTGKFAGKRLPVRDTLGLSSMEIVENRVVRWSDDALFLTVNWGAVIEYTFVKAADLDFIEPEGLSDC